MYIQEYDILRQLFNDPAASHEDLSARSGHPARILARILESLRNRGYIDENDRLTEQALRFAEERKPGNAIILAAGYGMRMVPINHSIPKA
nr:choline kinase [Solobacterium sp.]